MARAAAPLDDNALDDEADGATRHVVLCTAERLFALHGFQTVSVRDITAEAGVNLASVNYHFGSKDALLFAIFKKRTSQLNRERAKMLHEAADRHAGKPPVRDILEALFGPPVRWLAQDHPRRVSMQFIIRARGEGGEDIHDLLRNDVSHLVRFAGALLAARPDLPPETVYWRLHFCLGLIHNNNFGEMERINRLSDGATRDEDVEALLVRMLDFAEAGFLA